MAWGKPPTGILGEGHFLGCQETTTSWSSKRRPPPTPLGKDHLLVFYEKPKFRSYMRRPVSGRRPPPSILEGDLLVSSFRVLVEHYFQVFYQKI